MDVTDLCKIAKCLEIVNQQSQHYLHEMICIHNDCITGYDWIVILVGEVKQTGEEMVMFRDKYINIHICIHIHILQVFPKSCGYMCI